MSKYLLWMKYIIAGFKMESECDNLPMYEDIQRYSLVSA